MGRDGYRGGVWNRIYLHLRPELRHALPFAIGEDIDLVEVQAVGLQRGGERGEPVAGSDEIPAVRL